MNEMRVISKVADEINDLILEKSGDKCGGKYRKLIIPLEVLSLESPSPRLLEEMKRLEELFECINFIEDDGKNLIISIDTNNLD